VAQEWDPQQYGKHGAFVHGLAGGVLEWLNARPGERILDVGCGDGQLTARMAAAGVSVVGLDSSAQMAAAARARGIEVTEGSAEKMPFAAQSFDAVFSNAALHWVRDHDAMMSEVKRVLKPGGRFVAEMGGHGNVAAILVAVSAALSRHGFAGRQDSVNYYPTPEAYARRFTAHGFAVERMELIPRPTPLGEGGMEAWIRTFRRGILELLPEEVRASVVEDAVAMLTPVLCDEEGNWTADYVRLRFAARNAG
jgi:SAM-dependent methyltransferase